ncbi:hypothetical protein DLAC_04573 [Tieghemostelium lacteum]|uniref:Uncharacterized protein n=1 Tax=Tieghemostelium lacteum TaxID=361077 RepID=A0A151ZKD3_TIELA|nr:hypothetical protein DLAC_04573 [Tieghemostelium lacteum]|eukprot:KYQ94274.1 hypothetical protein DLAC_04573 [Tieghemostelium lacteum]
MIRSLISSLQNKFINTNNVPLPKLPNYLVVRICSYVINSHFRNNHKTQQYVKYKELGRFIKRLSSVSKEWKENIALKVNLQLMACFSSGDLLGCISLIRMGLQLSLHCNIQMKYFKGEFKDMINGNHLHCLDIVQYRIESMSNYSTGEIHSNFNDFRVILDQPSLLESLYSKFTKETLQSLNSLSIHIVKLIESENEIIKLNEILSDHHSNLTDITLRFNLHLPLLPLEKTIMSPILNSLVKISIVSCSCSYTAHLIQQCNSLLELIIDGFEDNELDMVFHSLFNNTKIQLIRFNRAQSKVSLLASSIVDLLNHNSTLVKLQCHVNGLEDLSSIRSPIVNSNIQRLYIKDYSIASYRDLDILSCWSGECKVSKTLSKWPHIPYHGPSILQPNNLKNLKLLKILECTENELSQLIRLKLGSLKSLQVDKLTTDTDSDQLVSALNENDKINKLSISDCSDTLLLNLIRNAVNIRDLRISISVQSPDKLSDSLSALKNNKSIIRFAILIHSPISQKLWNNVIYNTCQILSDNIYLITLGINLPNPVNLNIDKTEKKLNTLFNQNQSLLEFSINFQEDAGPFSFNFNKLL